MKIFKIIKKSFRSLDIAFILLFHLFLLVLWVPAIWYFFNFKLAIYLGFFLPIIYTICLVLFHILSEFYLYFKNKK